MEHACRRIAIAMLTLIRELLIHTYRPVIALPLVPTEGMDGCLALHKDT